MVTHHYRAVWSEAVPSHVSDVGAGPTAVPESHAQEVQGAQSVSGASYTKEHCTTGQHSTPCPVLYH